MVGHLWNCVKNNLASKEPFIHIFTKRQWHRYQQIMMSFSILISTQNRLPRM
ncbi:hypothetical protein JCM18903_2515 [Psychrobacter sp. JCM 18903]|nr:hypothetical protein JCM18903_2515 [Psychrobacter sp. JCM 18903]